MSSSGLSRVCRQAFLIYKKCNLNAEAMETLLTNVESMERAQESAPAKRDLRPNGYLVLVPASSSRMCLHCAVLRCMFPWRTRYPLSYVPIKPLSKEFAARVNESVVWYSSGVSRIQLIHSLDQIPCSSNVCLGCCQLFSDSSNRGMSKQYPLTVYIYK